MRGCGVCDRELTGDGFTRNVEIRNNAEGHVHGNSRNVLKFIDDFCRMEH